MTVSLWIVDLALAVLPHFKKPVKPREGWVSRGDYALIIVAYNGYAPIYLGEDEENVIIAMDGESKTEAIKRALALVDAPYVVLLDGDTVPGGDLRLAVQALADSGADVASVKVLPIPLRNSILERLQHVEYSIAMRARRWAPWLVSGAMIVARTESMKRILERHSGNFDGEDLEIGLLAKQMGMKVIHVDFPAYTEVPASLKQLIKQRIRWFKGFARLSMKFWRLPALIPHSLYWWILFALMTPLKILSLDASIIPLAAVYAIYLMVTIAAKPPKAIHVALFPLYGLLQVIIVPIAAALSCARGLMKKLGSINLKSKPEEKPPKAPWTTTSRGARYAAWPKS
ncbi:MAG: glycosyltransferase family 2 protein [Nitrososphaerota archaeon]